ncbi:MAG: O-antigen ligase family protein [Candidatus Omnitrophota bacterium]
MKKINLSRSQVEDIFLIGLLLFAPLALASVHTWAYCTIAIVALLLFNLHFLGNLSGTQHPAPSTQLLGVLRVPISIGALIFLIINLLYLVPFPAAVIKLLSPSAYNLRETYMLDPAKWQTLSIYPRDTVGYLLKIVSYIMVFLVVVSKIWNNTQNNSNDHSSPIAHHTSHAYIQLGVLCSILSILFHSLCDFNLHIPANALYFTVMVAIAVGLHTKNEQRATNNDFVNLLTNSIIIIGFAIAVFGIIQRLSYNGKIYWLIEKAGSHFGPYVNYDHYAGYMEMCIFLAVSFFIGKISSSSVVRIKKLKERIIWLSSREANTTLIYLFLAIVMATALFMTTSRGGIMSFLAALAVFYFTCVISATRRTRNRMLLASVLLIILAIVMFAWVGPEETIGKFKVLQAMIKTFIKERAILSEIRPHMWKDTFNLIKDYPVFGTGLGTYVSAFTKYRTFSAHYGLLRYAHNDYLQLIAEIGIFGGSFILAFIVWYIRRFRECFRRLKEIK